jgi:hypothetical protein
MKALTAFGVVVALASAPAFAGPKKMSDAQMDNVTGGALVNAILVDVVDVNNNNVQVAVPVNAAVAAGILGNAGAVSVQRPGRQVIP